MGIAKTMGLLFLSKVLSVNIRLETPAGVAPNEREEVAKVKVMMRRGVLG